MRRVKFKNGDSQRKFLKQVLDNLNCPSLRALNQFGFDIPYSTLKNYFVEERLLPEDFFKDLCYLAKIEMGNLEVDFLEENWGKIKGGKWKK